MLKLFQTLDFGFFFFFWLVLLCLRLQFYTGAAYVCGPTQVQPIVSPASDLFSQVAAISCPDFWLHLKSIPGKLIHVDPSVCFLCTSLYQTHPKGGICIVGQDWIWPWAISLHLISITKLLFSDSVAFPQGQVVWVQFIKSTLLHVFIYGLGRGGSVCTHMCSKCSEVREVSQVISQGLNSSCQAWQQASLPSEPSHQSSGQFLNAYSIYFVYIWGVCHGAYSQNSVEFVVISSGLPPCRSQGATDVKISHLICPQLIFFKKTNSFRISLDTVSK